MKLLRSGLLVLVVFSLLMLPWPGLREAASAVFRAVFNATFALAGWSEVTFHPQLMHVVSPDDPTDTWTLPADEIVIGFAPFAVFVALLVGTPVGWSRRRRAFLFGSLLLYAYILVRLLVMLWLAFWGHTSFCPGAHAGQGIEHGSARWFVRRALETFHLEPMVYFTVPVLIWIVAVFRRSDWSALSSSLSGRQKLEG